MNITKEIKRISKDLTANSASQQYREKMKLISSDLSRLQKALTKHAADQKKEPEHYGYVGDLNFIDSQLKEIIETLGDRK